MSKIFSFILFLVGMGFLFWVDSRIALGVFLLVWANNIDLEAKQ